MRNRVVWLYIGRKNDNLPQKRSGQMALQLQFANAARRYNFKIWYFVESKCEKMNAVSFSKRKKWNRLGERMSALNQKIIIKFLRQTKDHVRKLIFICCTHTCYVASKMRTPQHEVETCGANTKYTADTEKMMFEFVHKRKHTRWKSISQKKMHLKFAAHMTLLIW